MKKVIALLIVVAVVALLAAPGLAGTTDSITTELTIEPWCAVEFTQAVLEVPIVYAEEGLYWGRGSGSGQATYKAAANVAATITVSYAAPMQGGSTVGMSNYGIDYTVTGPPMSPPPIPPKTVVFGPGARTGYVSIYVSDIMASYGTGPFTGTMTLTIAAN